MTALIKITLEWTQEIARYGVLNHDIRDWLIENVGLQAFHLPIPNEFVYPDLKWYCNPNSGPSRTVEFFFIDPRDAALFKLVWS